MGYANIFVASPCNIAVKTDNLSYRGKSPDGLRWKTSIAC